MATPETVWQAFTEPRLLAAWLAPAGMRSEVHALDVRPGGQFAMSLTYETPEGQGTGKSTANTDTFRARFVDVEPGRLERFAGTFDSEDSELASSTMTLTFTLGDAPGGTLVTAVTEDIPEAVSLEDNEAGSLSSLENLKQLLKGLTPQHAASSEPAHTRVLRPRPAATTLVALCN